MTPLSPSRGRSLAAATIASLALGATGAATAQAGIHYPPKKCQAVLKTLIHRYGDSHQIVGPHVTKKQAAAAAKKFNAGVNDLVKHHGCEIGG